jgi:hypothetical protein
LNIGVFKEGLPMPSTSRQRRFQFPPGWPKTFGTGGRIQSEWVAGYSRNPQEEHRTEDSPESELWIHGPSRDYEMNNLARWVSLDSGSPFE